MASIATRSLQPYSPSKQTTHSAGTPISLIAFRSNAKKPKTAVISTPLRLVILRGKPNALRQSKLRPSTRRRTGYIWASALTEGSATPLTGRLPDGDEQHAQQ